MDLLDLTSDPIDPENQTMMNIGAEALNIDPEEINHITSLFM
jgi:hypothetical protein